MRIILLLLSLLVSVTALSQTPRLQVFAGASGVRVVSGPVSTNYFDGQGEVTLALTRHLGIVGDFGEQRHLLGISGGHAVEYTYQGLAGLQYSFSSRHGLGVVTPFVHGLAGITRVGIGRVNVVDTTTGITTTVPPFFENGIAVAAGGGLDWNLVRVLAIRFPQLDWMPQHLHQNPWTLQSYRVGVGLVLRFGRRRGPEAFSDPVKKPVVLGYAGS